MVMVMGNSTGMDLSTNPDCDCDCFGYVETTHRKGDGIMSDYISRQMAIDDVLNLKCETRVSWKDAVIDSLEDLPSADVRENVRGEWSLVTDRYGVNGEYVWKCSACSEMTICKGDFCPNCGADMRGDNHDK